MTTRPQAITHWLEVHEQEAIRFLEALVNQDSGTYDRAGVNQVGDILARAYEDLGFSVGRIQQAEFGDHLLASHGTRTEGKSLLCVGHMDTVYPAGTAAARPFRIEGHRATGPGALDMKGGLTVLLFAFHALAETDSPAFRGTRFSVLVNSDEEVGSPSSRQVIGDLAQRHDAAVVLEPARPGGECVIGRKGVGHFRLEVFGRQAHAGSQPELGINAIWELAHKVCAVQALGDRERGTTLNVGVIRGGERSNVVPDYACADVDLRVWSLEEAERVGRALREVADRATVAGATAKLTGEISNPPWQTDDGTRRMLSLLQQAGSLLGIEVNGVTTGGGSDGSRTAQYIPTLDGLGPVGSQMHSPEEYLELPSLRERAALLAVLIETWHERFQP
ncbi:MAG TPA: M20 family metallopeptidase [Candidatus Methylomirabilis sp.]|nr:M20 family metallopeptidase [Candidatus Methylomirabilis sp.]